MKLRFFTVVAMSPEADQDTLNAFLANHRVVTVRSAAPTRHWAYDGIGGCYPPYGGLCLA